MNCTNCRLHETRRQAVPGEGPACAQLFIIGEAPGEQEDFEGRPFAGRSGKYFDERLAEAGVERKACFITSSVKCRPPKNRNPRVDELEECKRLWLEKQIELREPSLVLLLGRTAARQLLGLTEKISGIHGKLHKHDKFQCLVTFHPAAGMRFPKIDSKIRQDFSKLSSLL